MNEIQKLFAKIEVLPPAPTLIPKLMPALTDLNANFDEVVKMIEVDPALTAKLLQICNSAFFGPAHPVTEVRQAVNQAGYQSVYLLASILSGSECFQMPEVPGVNSKHIWKHSLTSAYGSRSVAEAIGLEPGTLFTAGLLHDIGKVVLARARGQEYGLLLIRAVQSNTPVYLSEETAYGYNHAEVGARLLERWDIPPQVVAGVRYHHKPSDAPAETKKIAACVNLGNFLAHAQDKPMVLEDPDFNFVVGMLNLSADKVRECRERLGESKNVIEMMSKK